MIAGALISALGLGVAIAMAPETRGLTLATSSSLNYERHSDHKSPVTFAPLTAEPLTGLKLGGKGPD